MLFQFLTVLTINKSLYFSCQKGFVTFTITEAEKWRHKEIRWLGQSNSPRGVNAQGKNRIWTPGVPALTFIALLSYEISFFLFCSLPFSILNGSVLKPMRFSWRFSNGTFQQKGINMYKNEANLADKTAKMVLIQELTPPEKGKRWCWNTAP